MKLEIKRFVEEFEDATETGLDILISIITAIGFGVMLLGIAVGGIGLVIIGIIIMIIGLVYPAGIATLSIYQKDEEER